jgi:CMP-N-acetylneuraminic acid synthetase
MRVIQKKNRIYGLIPAKLNSKSIYQKNLQKIKKKSLLEITIDQKKKVKKIDEIYVSSENRKIEKICKNKGVIFFKRNRSYSTIKALASSVILEFIKKNKLTKNDSIVYLQPTSPFRKHNHINTCLSKFKKNKNKTLVSIKKVNFSIFKCISLNSKGLNPIFDEKFLTSNRQSFPEAYIPNGAIYIFLVKDFLKNKSIPHKNSIPFLMNEKDSLDIDSISDLRLARNL